MTTNEQPTLIYHAQQFRVRLEITKAQAMLSEQCPPDLVQRARTKLESVKSSGKIAFFDIYEDRLADIWAKLRKDPSAPQNLTIGFTLGAGCPDLVGLKVEKGANERAAVVISLDPNTSIKTWTKEWMRTFILYKAKTLGITEPLSMGQIQACLTRILSGEKVQPYSIPFVKTFVPTDGPAKTYGLVANKVRGEIAVVVHDLKALQTKQTIDALCSTISQSLEKLRAQTPGAYSFYKEELIECIKGAWKGPERLGVGLPMTILAVISRQATSGVANPVGALPPGSKYFSVKIAEDKMSATIFGFKTETFSDPKVKFTQEFFDEELKACGVVAGVTDEAFQEALTRWEARQTLDHLKIKGIPCTEGGAPYLHLVYKDAPKTTDTEQVINIREAQQRTLVQTGQLVAEIRFKTPPVPGKTVTGGQIKPTPPSLPIKVGDGINQREAGKFYAAFDGLPVVDKDSISITKIFVHEGDVDLKSGNIHFEGPVEIKGSVDSGAVVSVGGPLLIHGTVRGGFVTSKKSIEVRQGIVTTDRGKVTSGGDLKASFIENSRISCGGNMVVQKAVVNSHVFVFGSILITADDGIIGGGVISCRDALIANNIGFPSGARTSFVLGADVRAIQRVSIRKTRVEKIKEAAERYRLELREISGKKPSQLTAKLKERKEKLMDLIQKVKPVLEHVEQAVTIAQGRITFNNNAFMAAFKTLSSNCDVEIVGQTVELKTDMLGTAITAKTRKDSHLCTTEEIKGQVDKMVAQLTAAAPEKAPTADKKAG